MRYTIKHNNVTINNVSNDTQIRTLRNKLITSEVNDAQSYIHFKKLVSASKSLCKGKMHSNKSYKVHIALSKNYETLKKTHHYRILYIHNNSEIVAYIAVKLYKHSGGFMFIHKLCSNGDGHGTTLMNIILDDAKQNYTKLGITYLSLTTHNLDLINYYNKFNPTRTEIVNNPGTKALIPKKCAYMIWQLSPNMPNYNYS